MIALIPSFHDLPDSTLCRCDNCGAESELHALNGIQNPSERLTPGEEIPAGECPECGALAYLANPPEWVMAGREAREVLAPSQNCTQGIALSTSDGVTHMAHNFTGSHVTAWKDGAFFDTKDATHIVSYDQSNHAYKIEPGEYLAFLEWVAIHWPGDDDGQENGESTPDFLDRIGVTVREL